MHIHFKLLHVLALSTQDTKSTNLLRTLIGYSMIIYGVGI